MAFTIHQVTQNSKFSRYVSIDNVEYGIIEGVNIVKFGYNCEPKGLAPRFPIYINFTNGLNPTTGTKIQIGKNAIYEASYKEDSDKQLYIHSFAVPVDLRFTCDYVISTTTIN